MEITRGAAGDHWHAHLHGLFVGSYIAQEELSACWLRVTGDSRIVDIREVKEHRDGIQYLTQYVAKGWSGDILRCPDHLEECVLALRGVRFFNLFGSWRRIEAPEVDEGPDDWHKIGRLDVVAAAAIDGQEWAIGIVRSLSFFSALPVGAIKPSG